MNTSIISWQQYITSPNVKNAHFNSPSCAGMIISTQCSLPMGPEVSPRMAPKFIVIMEIIPGRSRSSYLHLKDGICMA